MVSLWQNSVFHFVFFIEEILFTGDKQQNMLNDVKPLSLHIAWLFVLLHG